MVVMCCGEGENCMDTDEAQRKDWRMTYPSCKAILAVSTAPTRSLCVKVVTDDRQGAKKSLG